MMMMMMILIPINIQKHKRNVSWILGISLFIFQMHKYTSGIIGESYFLHTPSPQVHIASQASVGALQSIPRASPMSVDHSQASPLHGVNKAVDKGHWTCGPYPQKSYTQICCSYRPWSQVIGFSLDFVQQVLYWIQIRTDGRPWNDFDVLLEKVPGGFGSVRTDIVLLKHVMLVMDKIEQNMKSKD